MTQKLWQTANVPPHPVIESYTIGDDFELDQKLLGYDIQASKAHAAMLQHVGIITVQEMTLLTKALNALYKAWQRGTFTIKKEQEDGHTAIEAYLVGKLGDTGKKIHTARSRNDQALTMMRLYLKDNLQATSAATAQLAKRFAKVAATAGPTAMPGYTHMQKAMPTTVASWLLSYADGLMDAQQLIDGTLRIIDQNPLGSAAGFDITLSIDREHTTRTLGFDRTQTNPMYCGLSRGLFELLAVQALNPVMVLAGKFAQDMMLFTTDEYDFFSLPETFTTGSSIMPHKYNYDLFEIMRAKAHMFGTYAAQLQSVISGVGSGYHRDLQITKKTTLQAFTVAQDTISVLSLTVPQLKIHKQKLADTISPEMNSVATINELVSKGMPFRDAYRKVKRDLSKQE